MISTVNILLSLSILQTNFFLPTTIIKNFNQNRFNTVIVRSETVPTSTNIEFYKSYSKSKISEYKVKKAEEERLAKIKAEQEAAKKRAAVQAAARVAKARKVTKTRVASTQRPAATGSKLAFESYIHQMCGSYGCNPNQLIRVMYCESGGRSNAYNRSGASGLFQFMPRTFAANSARVGIPNADIWNPYHQIQTAAWMFANGQSGQWVCK